jgi:hypothetical protein
MANTMNPSELAREDQKPTTEPATAERQKQIPHTRSPKTGDRFGMTTHFGMTTREVILSNGPWMVNHAEGSDSGIVDQAKEILKG